MLSSEGESGSLAAALVRFGGRRGASPGDHGTKRVDLGVPRVISDGTRDHDHSDHEHVELDGARALLLRERRAHLSPDALRPGPTNPPLWTEIDFDIWLTSAAASRHWVAVGRGRTRTTTTAEPVR